MTLFLILILDKTLVFLRYVFCAFHHLYCYSSSLLWVLVIWPLRQIVPALFWRLFDGLIELLTTMGTWYTWSAGYGIVEVGDDISPCYHDRTLVLINHQTAGDIVVLWNIFSSKPQIIKDSMWIMNEEFKFTPFGILCAIRKDFFIPIGKEKREQGLVNFKKHLKQWYLPSQKKTIILFPEGGFLYKRREKSQMYALQHNLPVMKNVCLPRLGAVQTILDVCTAGATESAIINGSKGVNNELKWILDVTIMYPGGIPLSIATLCGATRQPFNTTVLYRLFPASQVPCGPNQVADWLYSRWQEKEDILSKFYATGTISVDDICLNPVAPRLLKQNAIQHVIIHIFFFLSFYGFYKILCFLITPNIMALLIVMYVVFLVLKVTKVI